MENGGGYVNTLQIISVVDNISLSQDITDNLNHTASLFACLFKDKTPLLHTILDHHYCMYNIHQADELFRPVSDELFRYNLTHHEIHQTQDITDNLTHDII